MPYIKTDPLVIAGMVKPSDDYVFYDKTIPTAKRLKWDAEAEAIVEDLSFEQAILDGMTSIAKLAIRRALRAMGEEQKLNAILAASPEFAADWADSTEIDMADPMTLLALQSADIDVDAVKRKIIEMKS